MSGTRVTRPELRPAPPWVEASLCAQTDPELFYPERGGSALPAKKVCARCPVRRPCLQWALDTDERHGVWGGLTNRQRRHLKLKQAAAA